MSNHTIDSFVSLLFLLGVLALLIGRLGGSPTLPGRIFRALVGTLVALSLASVVVAKLSAVATDITPSIAAVGSTNRTLVGGLIALVVIGHSVLFVFLLRRRLTRDARTGPRPPGDAASRRSRSILPDHLEGP